MLGWEREFVYEFGVGFWVLIFFIDFCCFWGLMGRWLVVEGLGSVIREFLGWSFCLGICCWYSSFGGVVGS